MEKMLLKSTTRHVRIFTADVVNNDLQFHPNKLTLDLILIMNSFGMKNL